MTKQSKVLSTLEAGSPRRTGRDPMLEWMRANGQELSVQRWLELQFPEGVPNPLPPELEIPPELAR